MVPANRVQTTLVLVPLGLTATGVAVVLLDDPDCGGAPFGSAFVAAGVLGELLLLLQRLERLFPRHVGAVNLLLPWLAFFAIWIVLLRTTERQH